MRKDLLVLVFLSAAIPTTWSAGIAGMTKVISVSCNPHVGVSPKQSNIVCSEFIDFLTGNYPRLTFNNGTANSSRIDLTVTQANERGIGLEVVWVDDAGMRTTGIPLRASFFDRAADQQMRQRFFVTFLQHNPLPF
jgi:hypothetical protein